MMEHRRTNLTHSTFRKCGTSNGTRPVLVLTYVRALRFDIHKGIVPFKLLAPMLSVASLVMPLRLFGTDPVS